MTDDKDGLLIELPTTAGTPEQVHIFEPDELLAIDTAVAAQRPLLVRGEPGTGKTQLAKAWAKKNEREFHAHTVDVRTEARDLQYHFDAVARLGKAQTLGALGGGSRSDQMVKEALAIDQFVEPRALWWGFDRRSAADQAKRAGIVPPPPSPWARPENGAVVLIDEIDKADADVPNGLLEALGMGQFRVPGRPLPVTIVEPPPLIVITSNDERALPDAFLRRCVLLVLRLPDDREELIRLLTKRAHFHFPELDPEVVMTAAEMLADDRAVAKSNSWRPLPGQAELLDLLRAAKGMESTAKRQQELLGMLKPFVLRKHQTA